jgi:hypothetical protein
VHCTNSQSGRHIFRSFYQDYLDQAAAYRTTEAYQKALRKRLVWVEPLFGEAKQWHNMVRFRLRGLQKVNIEGVLKAAGQNIKRFLNYNMQVDLVIELNAKLQCCFKYIIPVTPARATAQGVGGPG